MRIGQVYPLIITNPDLAVATVPGRQDAVHHIYTPLNSVADIGRLTDAHQIAGTLVVQR